MTQERSALDVLTDFLMSWDIEDYGSRYTAQRAIEALEAAGFLVVSCRAIERPTVIDGTVVGEVTTGEKE